MEEKSRLWGFLTWEQEREIEKYVKEMKDNGMERRALENAHKWIIEHPEYQFKLNLPYKPIL
jgi:hypothetical protein